MPKYHLIDLQMQKTLDGLGDPELKAFTKALNDSADKTLAETPQLGAIRASFDFEVTHDKNTEKTYLAKLTLDIPKLLIRQMDDQFWEWYPADSLIPARNSTLFLECSDGSKQPGFYQDGRFWTIAPNGDINPLSSVTRFAYFDVRLDQLNFVRGAP